MIEYQQSRKRNGKEYFLTYVFDVYWDKCIGCATCVRCCGEEVFQMVNTPFGFKAKLVAPERCLGEGHCVKKCPTQAVKIIKTNFIENEKKGKNNAKLKEN